MLVPAPMLIVSLSPRTTVFHQMLALSPSRTSPITVALGATHASCPNWGWAFAETVDGHETLLGSVS
jgi:hypothetical protein